MHESVGLVMALLAGVFLGSVFFGGLWWTVRRGLSSKQPALWFFGSTLLRTAIVLAGFYLVSGGHWQRLVACLLGLVIARQLVIPITRVTEKSGYSRQGTRHAS
ncbi:MAG: ATP synthase subunit I [Acidobacteriota bacterium]